MSIFRSRKKSFNEADAGRRPSLDEAPPMPSTGLGKYSFRRKKSQPEAKKEIDLTVALPSTDDFRTSLLMPNLSARFSMLREQDDPNTKVGKASDDSVLFPKRLSRLNLFAAGDLADISEVASLSGSIKPPFAAERSSTYSAGDAGYTTDEEGRSVMTRARPGQGNRFFGGRQKVYMLSAKDGESNMSKNKGRAVYDDDINLVSYKASLDQQRPSEDTDRDSNAGYNSKRETSSSTNSGPFESRMSTAATSVASATPSPAGTNHGFANKFGSFSTANADRPAKGKRLYGQGLEQQIYEQQSSALNRLNSIQRNTGNGPSQYGGVSPVTRSGSIPNANSVQPIRIPSSASTGVESLKSITSGFDFGIAPNTMQETPSKPFPSPAIPMSPPMSPVDPTLVAALDANDIGKATAAGVFNKPTSPYNDEQYAKRQLQLQQGREVSQPSPVVSIAGTSEINDQILSRERGSLASQNSGISWQSSQAHKQTSIREQSSRSQLRDSDTPSTTQQAANGVFFANISGSENGSEPTSPHGLTAQTLAKAAFAGTLDPALRHRKYEHDDQHPAFSSHVEQSDEIPSSESSPDLPLQSEDPLPSLPANATHQPINEIIAQGGLIDLVRGHLRNISNQSSVYPDSPPRSSHGDSPEFPADFKDEYDLITNIEQTPDSLATRARLLLENATQLRYASTKPHDVLGGMGIDKAQQILGGEAPRRSNDNSRVPEMPWQEHFKNHNRQGSTETQREREEFANELADRRKQLQDSLRNLVSDDAQSISRRVNEYNTQRHRPGGFQGVIGVINSASRSENSSKLSGTKDEKYRVEHSNKNGTVPVQGTSMPNGGSAYTSRQNYGHQASEALRRGIEQSPPKTTANSSGFGYSRPPIDLNQPQGQYHPAGRARKYSPPNPLRRDDPGRGPYQRSASAQGRHSPALRSAQPNASYFPPSVAPNQTSVFHDSPRASPRSPSFSNHIVPSPEHTSFMNDAVSRNDSSSSLVIQGGRKGSINKYEISPPTLLSGTSSLATVDSPSGAALNISSDSGNSGAPPLPPINPRRQRQNFFSSFSNKSASNLSSLSTPSSTVTTPSERTPFLGEDPRDVRSQFLDNGDDKPRFKNRLRKSSSAGENMSQRARYQAVKDLDRMPGSPKVSTINLGMF